MTEADNNKKFLINLAIVAMVVFVISVAFGAFAFQAPAKYVDPDAAAKATVAPTQKPSTPMLTVGDIHVEEDRSGLPVAYSWVESGFSYDHTVVVKVVINDVEYYKQFTAKPGTTPFEIMMYKGPSMSKLAKFTWTADVKLVK